MTKSQSLVLKELESIRKKNKGLLNPEDVVNFAKNPETALHSRFTWEDSEAAHQYRLWEARQIIRVVVTMDPISKKHIRAFVSLSPDRTPNAGYRATAEVLDSAALTKIMLHDALIELTKFRDKYAELKNLAELHDVFEAIDKATKSKPSKSK